MRPAYAFHSATRSPHTFLRAFAFFLSPLAHPWWKIAWKNGCRARQIIRFPSQSFDLFPFLQTRLVTTVLGCIRKANVIIYARILGVPLRHVWEPVALRVVVGGSCKLLLYSVCHFHDAGIKFFLSSLRYFYGPCTNPYIYDSQAAIGLPIILLYKFISQIP